jgi:hypothetical protein
MLGIDDRFEGPIWGIEYDRYQKRLSETDIPQIPYRLKYHKIIKTKNNLIAILSATLNVIESFHEMAAELDFEPREALNGAQSAFIKCVKSMGLICTIMKIKFSQVVNLVKEKEFNYLQGASFQKLGQEHHDAIVTFLRGLKEPKDRSVLINGMARILLLILWIMNEKFESAWRNMMYRDEQIQSNNGLAGIGNAKEDK